jgi:hypothetical protein
MSQLYGVNNFNPYQNPISPNTNNFIQQQPQNNLIRVTGIDGAKAYQMSPNSSVALFDSDSDIMYVKTTDGAGFPTIRTFKFEAIENASNIQESYITREEFNELKQEVENYGKQFIQRTEKSTK